MIAMIEELKLLKRRIGAGCCPCTAAYQPPGYAPLLSVAMSKGIVNALAVYEGDAAGDAAAEASSVFLNLRTNARLSGKYMLAAEIAVLEAVEAVEVNALVSASAFDHALTLIVIEEACAVPGVCYVLDPVLFIPGDDPGCVGGLAGPPGHVAVFVIGVKLVAGIGNSMGLRPGVLIIEVVVRLAGLL